MSFITLPPPIAIFNIYEKLLKLTDQPANSDALDQAVTTSTHIEADLVTKFQVCQVPTIPRDIFSVDVGNLLQLLQTQYYNYDVIKSVQCIIWSMTSPGPSNQGVSHNPSVIRNWFNVKEKLSSGFAGQVFIGNIKQVKNVIALKASANIVSLTHELAIAYLVTNRMRQWNSNFAYIFAAFDCTGPIIDENDNVLTWCTSDRYYPALYLAYENIYPSVTMTEYCRTCTVKQFMSVLFQLMLALSQAKSIFDFTHFDPHTQNILIRDLPNNLPSAYLAYDLGPNNPKIYVEAEKVGVFIDFGLSHARPDGGNIGHYRLQEFGILPNSSFPLFDFYRMMMTSLQEMYREENYTTFDQLAPLVLQLNPNVSFVDIIEGNNELLYTLPALPHLMSVTWEQIITYVLKTVSVPGLIKKEFPTDKQVLSCPGTITCSSPAQVIDFTNVKVPGHPNTPIEMVEYLRQIDALRDGTTISFGTPPTDKLLVKLPSGVEREYPFTSPLTAVASWISQYNAMLQQWNANMEALRSMSEVDRDKYLDTLAQRYDDASQLLMWIIAFSTIAKVMKTPVPSAPYHGHIAFINSRLSRINNAKEKRKLRLPPLEYPFSSY